MVMPMRRRKLYRWFRQERPRRPIRKQRRRSFRLSMQRCSKRLRDPWEDRIYNKRQQHRSSEIHMEVIARRTPPIINAFMNIEDRRKGSRTDRQGIKERGREEGKGDRPVSYIPINQSRLVKHEGSRTFFDLFNCTAGSKHSVNLFI